MIIEIKTYQNFERLYLQTSINNSPRNLCCAFSLLVEVPEKPEILRDYVRCDLPILRVHL